MEGRNDTENGNEAKDDEETEDEEEEDETVFRAELPWDPDPSKVDYNGLLFNHLFPSVKGKAYTLDRFLCRSRSKYKRTVIQKNIFFCREEKRDPDMLVSILLTTAIAKLSYALKLTYLSS